MISIVSVRGLGDLDQISLSEKLVPSFLLSGGEALMPSMSTVILMLDEVEIAKEDRVDVSRELVANEGELGSAVSAGGSG